MPLRPAGDGNSSRGRSNWLSGAPGGRFVSFLRRPSLGLRFSRRTQHRAPDAGSTGSDNPGAAEVSARLLLLKIGSAGPRNVARRCGEGGLLPITRVDQHLPESLHPRSLEAGREMVFRAGVLVASRPGSWVTVRGVRLPSSVLLLQTPWLNQRPSPCSGGSLACEPEPRLRANTRLAPGGSEGKIYVARPVGVSRSWRAFRTFSLPAGAAWVMSRGQKRVNVPTRALF